MNFSCISCAIFPTPPVQTLLGKTPRRGRRRQTLIVLQLQQTKTCYSRCCKCRCASECVFKRKSNSKEFVAYPRVPGRGRMKTTNQGSQHKAKNTEEQREERERWSEWQKDSAKSKQPLVMSDRTK